MFEHPLPPAPPPAEVIVLKTEFEPELPGVVLGYVAPPPPPTVIGYVVALTVIPVGVAKGLAV